MLPFACTIIRRLAPVLAPAFVLAALGCQEKAESPTAPELGPALDITLAHALSFRHVSAGEAHTCGVTTADRAYCWGDNGHGALGDGTRTTRLAPVAVVGGRRFRQVSAGDFHTCGVTTADRAFCWGFNHLGQLGNGTTGPETCARTPCSTTPVAVVGGFQFRQVSAGGFHTCGVTTADRAYCWGDNSSGQLGDGTTTNRSRPVPVAGGLRFRQVSAGDAFTCGVTTDDKRAFCWGFNDFGALGDGTTTTRLAPVAVAGGRRFRQVKAGGFHTCGVTPADLAFCWGRSDFGQLGNGTSTGPETCVFDDPCSTRPVRVIGGLQFGSVNAGGLFTCSVTSDDNRAFCWGYSALGQLGNGTNVGPETCLVTTPCSTRPVRVAGGLQFRSVNGGHEHTCGVTTDNRAYCWGENASGELGDGTTTTRSRPVPVAGAT